MVEGNGRKVYGEGMVGRWCKLEGRAVGALELDGGCEVGDAGAVVADVAFEGVGTGRKLHWLWAGGGRRHCVRGHRHLVVAVLRVAAPSPRRQLAAIARVVRSAVRVHRLTRHIRQASEVSAIEAVLSGGG